MSMLLFGSAGILLISIALGQPLYVLIGALSAWLLLASGVFGQFTDLTNIIEMTQSLSEKEVLLAIPFFVIAGAIMSEGDIAKRLIGVAREAFCWLPGGLAVSAVAACIFFAAISGSSPVTVIAIGTIMVPAMLREGYSKKFAGGLVTSAGSLGILIPPSIPMIVYEIIDPTSLRDPANYNLAGPDRPLGLIELFLAGLGPGLLIGLIFAGYSIYYGRKHKTPTRRIDLRRFAEAARHGFWALMLPVLILGGIYGGIFTPTQAAAVSVIYALIVEFYIHRSLRGEDLPRILSDCTVLIGALLIIIALAQGFNKYLELAQVAEGAVALLLEWELSPIAFLLLVNILLLIVGCFMDILSAIIILVPLLSPIAFQLGIHPIHLAIVFIVNLEIGYLTPPLGLNLFVASTIFRESLGDVIRSVVPFLALMMLALALVTYIPTISLGPVSWMNGHGFFVPFPERRIAMQRLPAQDSIRFLAGIARAEEEPEDAEDARDPDRPLTIEEITRMAQEDMQREALQGALYDSLDAMLVDYRRIHRGNVRLQDLRSFEDLDLRDEDPGPDLEGDGFAPGQDPSPPDDPTQP